MIPTIFEERLLFYRERSAGAYGSAAYTLSSVAAPLRRHAAQLGALLRGARADGEPRLRRARLLPARRRAHAAGRALLLPVPRVVRAARRRRDRGVPGRRRFPARVRAASSSSCRLMPTLRCWAPSVSFARWAFQSLVISQFPPSRHPHDPVSIDEVVLATRLRQAERLSVARLRLRLRNGMVCISCSETPSFSDC